jgi:hypothetical protein
MSASALIDNDKTRYLFVVKSTVAFDGAAGDDKLASDGSGSARDGGEPPRGECVSAAGARGTTRSDEGTEEFPWSYRSEVGPPGSSGPSGALDFDMTKGFLSLPEVVVAGGDNCSAPLVQKVKPQLPAMVTHPITRFDDLIGREVRNSGSEGGWKDRRFFFSRNAFGFSVLRKHAGDVTTSDSP